MRRSIILSVIILALIFYYLYAGIRVPYEDITLENAPSSIREKIEGNEDHIGYQLIQTGTSTYIYYRANDDPNDYITTSVDVRSKFDQVVVTATVMYASNDGYVSDYKLIKLDKVSEDRLFFKEYNKAN
ncbi:hypothetical protein [Bacillus sp. KH172YL63]|uniref:hypothetical protein n=1 Tax=Bacillus sp. KH172YL63 TaxID=2709784 RepID=UPI0013E50C5D|nr:hypothetical protein [Bacillus sp. KH172YL63]BCB02532.1 hypothetical protein KH172YL63_06650 [Bacillus sp. KH172YL63]